MNWVSSDNDKILPYVDKYSSSDESFDDTISRTYDSSLSGPKETRRLKKKKDPHTGSLIHPHDTSFNAPIISRRKLILLMF